MIREERSDVTIASAHRGWSADSVLEYVQSYYLSPKQRRPGNERTRRFVHLSGVPVRDVSDGVVQITGTNGKGTTAIRIEQLLRAAGRNTLCLTSPHVYSVRERIRLNGRPVTWECLGGVLSGIAPYLETLRGTEWQPRPTDIWAWIALSLHACAGGRLEGIYEAGKGGGSDATNAFTGSVVGLTNIGTDHLAEFGGSQKSLLKEKLGLCSAGSALYHGPLNPDLEAQLQGHCDAHDIVHVRASSPSDPGGDTDSDCEERQNSSLARNIAQAKGVRLSVSPNEKVHLAARLQKRVVDNRCFILDGGHNLEATQRLVSSLRGRQVHRVLLLGVQAHKDWAGLIRLLARVHGLDLLVAVQTTSGKVVCSDTLVRCAQESGLNAIPCDGLLSALSAVLRLEWQECIVTGSFMLFRDFELALHQLGLGEWAIPLHEIDPQQPWMHPLR